MGTITITAKTPTENLETTLTIDSEATIENLTQEVAPVFDFDPERSVIMFRGDELPPRQTLKEAGIQDGFAVLVLPQGLPKLLTINIRNALSGQQTQVRIDSSATIRNVLERAVPELTLDITKVIPMHNEKRLILGQSLTDAGIEDGSTIVLTPHVEEPKEFRPQTPQPSSPLREISHEMPRTIEHRTISPADEKFLREKLGEYKKKADYLELKIKNSFLIPKKAVYILVVIIIIILAIVTVFFHFNPFTT